MNTIDPLIEAEAKVLKSLHPNMTDAIDGLLASGMSERAILTHARDHSGATPLILGLMAAYIQTKRNQ